jgi:hypothetical protein
MNPAPRGMLAKGRGPAKLGPRLEYAAFLLSHRRLYGVTPGLLRITTEAFGLTSAWSRASLMAANAGAANMATDSAESASMITIRLLIYSEPPFSPFVSSGFLRTLRGRILKLSLAVQARGEGTSENSPSTYSGE